MALQVVAGIIIDASEQQVLVAQRNKPDAHLGQWEFPGGKIEVGETPAQALVREIKEELDIQISDYRLFDRFEHQYPQRKVDLHYFLITAFSGQPQGMEQQRIQWLAIPKLAKIDMLEANRPIVKRLIAMSN